MCLGGGCLSHSLRITGFKGPVNPFEISVPYRSDKVTLSSEGGAIIRILNLSATANLTIIFNGEGSDAQQGSKSDCQSQGSEDVLCGGHGSFPFLYSLRITGYGGQVKGLLHWLAKSFSVLGWWPPTENKRTGFESSGGKGSRDSLNSFFHNGIRKGRTGHPVLPGYRKSGSYQKPRENNFTSACSGETMPN